MAEDFIRNSKCCQISNQDVMHQVLWGINDTLKSLGKEVDDYHIVPFSFVPDENEELTREVSSKLSLGVPQEDLSVVEQLNDQQRNAFDTLCDERGAYFVDGPGGTEKSFLYKVLLAHIRSRGFVTLVVAT
ncbi:hypothetical protein LIER_34741 [Lithospermum erythrorhizon]|uniref:ATP-dependent DNA helicase n=1 Tax=Lithospermum erythrorhizon TaxID=34254 RepID=A0AAV3S0G6_LITER